MTQMSYILHCFTFSHHTDKKQCYFFFLLLHFGVALLPRQQLLLRRVLGLSVGGLLHFQTFDPGVGRGAAEHHHVARPPQQAFAGRVEDHRNDGLRARLGRARHVVRQRAGELDLQARDVADGETEHPAERHHAPELEVGGAGEGDEAAQVSGHDDEREEEDAGVDVVVVGQFPDVSVHRWHHLLGVDGVQGDARAGQHTEKDAGPGEVTRQAFLVHTEPESTWGGTGEKTSSVRSHNKKHTK